MTKSSFLACLIGILSISISAQVVEIDTLLDSGIKDNRINFAFGNVDHATANAYESKSEFISDLQGLMNRFDPDSPLRKNGYSHYRNFFNVYSVWFEEPFVFEPVPAYYIESQAFIDNLFLPWADDQHGWVTMMFSLNGGGGGGAGRRDDLRRGDALIWGLEWETILHEFNHTMPGVGDEYTASGEWSNFVCDETPNQTPATVKGDVPWRNWIDEDTPIPTPYAEEYFGKVGAFEGTISGFFGCQRPTAQSCYMGAGGFGEGFGTDMCPVCLQRFICRTYQFVDAIEDELPSEQNIDVVTNETITFSVNTVKPIPNTQQYKWYLNGKCIAKNVKSLDITFGDCALYEVSFEILDTTEFVRYDEKFAYLYPEPRQTHTWNVNNSESTQFDLEAIITAMDADCSGQNTGRIIIEANGGEAPYTYIVNGKEYDSEIDNLSAGTYEIVIVDAIGCSVDVDIEIEQVPIFEYTLVSEFQAGVWKIYPMFSEDEDINNLSFSWSTGSNENTIYTTEKGEYFLEITSGPNCTVTKKIEISDTPCANLEVDHNVKHPSSMYDGAIYLDIKYGTEPYTIQWNKNEAVDRTIDNPDAVFSSGENPIHVASFLFDDRVDFSVDFWASGFNGENYAGYDFGEPTFIDFYSLTSNVDVQGRDAKDWTFEGSNDMVNWDVVDTKKDIVFENRREKKEFYLNQGVEYRYYRVFITKNAGDGWIAIQEMEFGATTNTVEIKTARDQPYLVDLQAGVYSYIVTDANGNRDSESIQLLVKDPIEGDIINVVQDGPETVKIENPDGSMDYYWFADAETSEFLHIGNTFQPLATGNYYVKSVSKANQTFTSATKGFAVTMQSAPEVDSENGTFTILNPNPDAVYTWYNNLTGGDAIHTGTSYMATEMGEYYVSMQLMITSESLIEPTEIGGITLWADASDIDGDNQPDIGLENSSAYKWKFKINGGWDGGWHAYRTNYSNGLGVVDLATVWFQYVANEPAAMRSFIITYEENGFSRAESAPFYGLKNYMSKNADQNKLFSEDISDLAKNGKVFLNGDEVNPQSTFNSYDMKSLSMVLDEEVSVQLFAIDEYWEGKIGEFIVFDKELNDNELKGIHAYMRKKWLSTADLASPRTKVSWIDGDFAFESSEEIIICYGHDYLGLAEEGTYIREMKTAEGYDSIVTTTIVYDETTEIPGIALNGNFINTIVFADSYQWYFNGVAIEGANSSEYFAEEEGDYSLVATYSDGCMAESNVISFVISNVKESDLIQFKVYPNPTSGFVSIENLGDDKLEFSINNSNGQVVKKGHVGSNINVVDISNLNSGIYTLIIKDYKNTVVKKLVKI